MSEEAAAPAVETARPRFWRTVLIFALAGPYIGLAISLFLMFVIGLAKGQSLAGLGAALLALGAVSAVFAIPLAGLPGFLTGLVAANMQRRGTPLRRYYALTGTVGALTALAIPLALRSGVEFWIFVGAGTAVICAHLTRAR